MATATKFTPPSVSAIDSYTVLADAFQRSLRAANRSTATQRTYSYAIRGLRTYLEAQGLDSDPPAITRDTIHRYVLHLLESKSPGTAATQFAALRVWFAWLEAQGEIDITPMRRMKAPHIPDDPPAVLTRAQTDQLLRACDGPEFIDRRDKAVLSLLVETGARRSEIAGLMLEDVDLDLKSILVMGKGRKPRTIPFGDKTARAITRYLVARSRHRLGSRPEFLIGHNGPLTADGIWQVLRKRTRQAGMDDVHPHQLRHSFAHHWLANGGSEGDLMRIMGWRSRSMLDRYAAATADQRAADSYRRMSEAGMI